MTPNPFITNIVMLVLLVGCSSKLEKAPVLIEKPSNLLLDVKTNMPFTGEVIMHDEDNSVFRGQVKNGILEGNCSWVQENGDSIQLISYTDGDIVFSCQYLENNRRFSVWIKTKPEITRSDSTFIYKVIDQMELHHFRVAQVNENNQPIAIHSKELSEFVSEYGKLQDTRLVRIDKTSYNFQSGIEMSFRVELVFADTTLNMVCQYINEKDKNTGLQFDIANDLKPEPTYYKKFEFWSASHL